MNSDSFHQHGTNGHTTPDHLHSPYDPDGTVNADKVEISQGSVQHVHASEVRINQSGAQRIEADDVVITQSGAGLITASTVRVKESGAGLILAERTELKETSVGFMLCDQAQVHNSRVAVLIAGEVQGDVQTLIDAKSALVLGAAAGVLFSLFGWLLGRNHTSDSNS